VYEKEKKGGNRDANPYLFCIIAGIFLFYGIDRYSGGCSHAHIQSQIPPGEVNGQTDANDVNGERVGNGTPQREENNIAHEKQKKSAALYLLADFLHNTIDGIGIGVSFSISIRE